MPLNSNSKERYTYPTPVGAGRLSCTSRIGGGWPSEKRPGTMLRRRAKEFDAVRTHKLTWLYLTGCLIVIGSLFGNGLSAATVEKSLPKKITIQISSIKDQAGAEKALQRYKDLGLDVFLRQEPVKDKGMWFRIYMGLFDTRQEAKDVAEDLVKQKKITSFWIKAIKNPPADMGMNQPPPAKTLQLPESEPTPEPPRVSVATPPIVAPPPVEESPTKETPSGQIPSVNRDGSTIEQVMKKFSIGIRAGGFQSTNVDTLTITDTDTGNSGDWIFSKAYALGGLTLSFQPVEWLFVRAGYEKAFFTKLDLNQITVGAGFNFKTLGGFTPYVCGDVIYGSLSWNDYPSGFETGLGWRIGMGCHYPIWKFRVGLETDYQHITYDIKPPPNPAYTSSMSRLDYSGLLLSAVFSYHF